MRKISYCLLSGLLWVAFYGCNKDSVSTPSQPSFTVDKTSGLVGQQFTFTVNQVNASSITLFPYGTSVNSVAQAGIPIDASSFVGGKAQVGVSYSVIGTFNAVVVANNHTANGNAISNIASAPQVITIGSSNDALTAFGLLLNPTSATDSVTFPVIFPKTGNNLTLTLPFGNGKTQTNLATGAKAVYSASPFSTVTLSSTNFTSPVTITVTANNGAAQTYTITSTVTPAEKIQSFTAKAKNVSKSAKNKLLPAAVDSIAKTIVIYDTLGSVASTDFDSLRFEYTPKGSFSVLKYGTHALKQDSLFNLSSATKTFVAKAQDSTSVTYTVYAAVAPKLTLSFGLLNPVVNPKTTNFGITADVLSGTTVTSIATTATIQLPAGVTVTGITANGSLFISGSPVDYTKPVAFVLTVNDPTAGTYLVTYTATVNVVN